MQIDNLNQLPKDKRPPEWMIWDKPPEDIEEWLDKVYGTNKRDDIIELEILENEIE